jgi:DNA-binding LacI/PurR family transcriptional regulator
MVLLDCGEERRLLSDLYLLELTRGIQDALLASGFGTVVNSTRGTLHRLVDARAVDAVVLATGVDRRILAREIAAKGTPCVVLAQSPAEDVPLVGWVYLDLHAGAREAARLLLDLGHRRIGCIGNYADDFVRAAFCDELATAGAPVPEERTVLAGSGRDAGVAAMHRLLRLPEPPTAVFARTDALASGALQAAGEVGIRVPEDLSIVGHDDVPLAERLGLTTIRIDCAEVGRAVARVLFGLLRDGSAPPEPPSVRTRVVVRRTTGVLAATPTGGRPGAARAG